MATTFLDLIVVLLWPLVLSAAAWAIAIYALAETDEISKVVEALTRRNEENAKRGEFSLRPSNLSANPSGDGRWFQVHFRRARYTVPNITLAKGLARQRTLLRDNDCRGDRAAVARTLRDNELSEHASP